MDATFIGALDIGGTKIAAMVANAQGPLARVTQPTAKTGSLRALPEQALILLDEACRQAGIAPDMLNMVGVCSCGPFARRDGMLGLATPNICGAGANDPERPNDWDVIPLEQVLRERFDKVVIENDCVAALVAERTFGAVQGEADCAYVTWSTGIGFAFCVDGNILHGKHGNAGHAGHMLMTEDQDALCGCGNRGDLEALISGRNLGKRLKMPAAELFNAARSGNEDAYAAAIQAAQRFGRGLYNVAAMLDTRVFVAGGSVWQHHGDWLAPIAMQEVEQRLPALTQGISIVPTVLGGLVADVGAMSLVMPQQWIVPWQMSKAWEVLNTRL